MIEQDDVVWPNGGDQRLAIWDSPFGPVVSRVGWIAPSCFWDF
jgi:hypothetical protein